MSAVPPQAYAVASQVVEGVLTIAGLLFWVDFALLIWHFVESRIHPTPAGRSSALGAFIDRAKGMLMGYLGVYLAIFFAVTALNILGAGLSFSQVFQYFFIQPIVNTWRILSGGG